MEEISGMKWMADNLSGTRADAMMAEIERLLNEYRDYVRLCVLENNQYLEIEEHESRTELLAAIRRLSTEPAPVPSPEASPPVAEDG